MQINSSSVWVVAAAPASALSLAIRDLARDWRRVFGRNPYIVNGPSEAGSAFLVLGSDAMHSMGLPVREVEPEGYCLEIVPLPGSHGRQLALCAYGSTLRGDIYAAYAVSSALFDVDPFHWWTDREPFRSESVVFDSYAEVLVPAPRFTYRGWFLNDEDLLTGWSPDPTGRTGISLDVWDKIFEALLRCRGNIVVPGTFIFPEEPQVALASRRGLIIAQDHLQVLGVNTYRWPESTPYSYAAHPEILENAWRKSVASYGESEVLWSVGYRGRHDRPFWYDDVSVGEGPAERGALISAAIRNQMSVVRERRADAEFFLNLWMEGVELQRQGHLVIPEGVSVVWPDDGHGRILDGGAVRPGDGAYYHTAMYNSFAAQLTEMVPPETIQDEIERLVDAGATRLLLVNVSDLRPCVMTTSYLMELSTGESSASEFYSRWAARQYGSSQEVAELWRGYFRAGMRYTTDDEIRLEDNAHHTLAHLLLKQTLAGQFDSALQLSVIESHVPRAFHLLGKRTLAQAADFLAHGTTSAQPAWDSLSEKAAHELEQIPPERRDFYRSHVVLQLETHRCGNALLGFVAQAVLCLAAGDRPAGIAALQSARELSEEILNLQRDAEYGKWAGFYGGDTCVAVPFTTSLLDQVVTAVQSGIWPSADAPPSLPVEGSPYLRVKQYQSAGEMWVDVSDTAEGTLV